MLIRKSVLEQIRIGTVTLAFRRWRRPSVKTGGTLKTAVGILQIDQVSEVGLSSITAKDARLAGYPDLAALKAELSARDAGSVHRIELRFGGPDPRVRLREADELSPPEIRQLADRLRRYDRAGAFGPWTEKVLAAIRSRPREKAGDLAASIGVPKEWLKTNVRKLKNLGLTISHEPGYELSPRGMSLFRALFPGRKDHPGKPIKE